MVIDVVIFELGEFILGLARLHKGDYLPERICCQSGVFCAVVVGFRSAGLRPMLHQRAGSPKIILAKISESRDFVDAKLVLAECLLSGCGVVPIYRKEFGSFLEVGRSHVGAFLI